MHAVVTLASVPVACFLNIGAQQFTKNGACEVTSNGRLYEHLLNSITRDYPVSCWNSYAPWL